VPLFLVPFDANRSAGHPVSAGTFGFRDDCLAGILRIAHCQEC